MLLALFPICLHAYMMRNNLTQGQKHIGNGNDAKEKGGHTQRTLLTRMVPAKPLRPAMPRGGGNAQSSPTITVCNIKDQFPLFLFKLTML